MKILKFGGSSLGDEKGLQSVISIIKRESQLSPITIVLSARGKATDQLIDLYEATTSGAEYHKLLENFILEQTYKQAIPNEVIDSLKTLLLSATHLKLKSQLLKNKILAYGEILSVYTLQYLLKEESIKTAFGDARELLIGEHSSHDEVEIDQKKSQALVKRFFETLDQGTVPIITGFLASDEEGNTLTLGRNGSNYTASLLAQFIDAEEVQNWTDVDGIYSASPKWVNNARRIEHLNYREANELANFGVKVLHAKTILPLIEKRIPLRVKHTHKPEGSGTLIDDKGSGKGIKAVSVIEDVALISIVGKGLLGKVGIDARIFSVLSANQISVRLISQASSERGIGFVVNKQDSILAEKVLKLEFKDELLCNDIASIELNTSMAIVAIVGRHNYALEKAIKGLRRNKIWLHLISNSISGEHISLAVDDKQLKKAVNVVHNQVFGVIKTLNVFALGKGTVGSSFLNQILSTSEETIERRKLKIDVVGIADSKRILFKEDGIRGDWQEQLERSECPNSLAEVENLLKNTALENVVIVDNTSSDEVSLFYKTWIKTGFDIVASNKKANSMAYEYYKDLRKELQRAGRSFYYETNVGAGLPLIDTLKNLYNSCDRVRGIRGVFSGSMSYVFNRFSAEDQPFLKVLKEAKEKGLTEPDPREDLGGTDVARKLIILAREVGLECEFDEVEIENLIPRELQCIDDYQDFMENEEHLNRHFESRKATLNPDEVFRFVGDLNVDEKCLKVSLVKASKNSPLGNIKNADSIFELYTDSYGEQPIVIQGAGAGAEVTAGGVYSDLLRISLSN